MHVETVYWWRLIRYLPDRPGKDGDEATAEASAPHGQSQYVEIYRVRLITG